MSSLTEEQEVSDQNNTTSNHSMDIDCENVPSSSYASSMSSKNFTSIDPLPEDLQEEDELRALGISAYDQSELESEVINQVNERIKVHEDESRRKITQSELKDVLTEFRSINQRLRHIDKALDMAPKESDPQFTKQTKKFIASIKQEKENKLKQLKKLKAKQKMLLKQCEEGVTLESMEQFIEEDEDVEMDEETKAHLDFMFGKKETNQEKLIKTGQMTPFGTVINKIEQRPKIKVANTKMTEFEKYLLDQSNLQTQKKTTSKKKSSKKLKKKKTSEIIEFCENSVNDKKTNIKIDRGRVKNKSSVNKVKNDDKVFSVESKRSRKSASFDEPGFIDDIDECTNGDSDWLPDGSDHGDYDDDFVASSDEIKHKEVRSKRKKKDYTEVNLSDDSESDYKKVRRSSKFKTVDDGDQEAYHYRLREYHKQKMLEIKKYDDDSMSGPEEEPYEEFEDGYRIISQIWDKLYDYQKIGVKWLWELHLQNCGGILGDEMGLGKTIQIIAFLIGLDYSNLKSSGDSYRGLGPTLIVCPTTLMHQWVREFHVWWPPFRVAVLHETGSHIGTKESLVRNVYKDNGVIVTSYNAVVKHQDLLVPRTWHYVILDEGHKIRNPDAQITLACKQLKTQHRVLLSGSPVQNNLKELWSLFDFIFPGKLGTLPVFMQQFSVPIVQGGYSNASKVQVETSYRCAVVLRNTINPYLLRRLKNDVKMSLQLPNKNEQVLFCRLSKEQIRCYKEYLASGEVNNILYGRLKVFVGLIALRKICNHPDLYSGGPEKALVASNITERSDDAKMQYGYYERAGKLLVVETLLKLWKRQGHRVLLFTQSKQMLDILEKYVQSKDYSYMRMDGGTSIASRQPAVNKFNTDGSIFLFLLTTQVGGLGLNLTGANRVVIYDPDWNPSTDTQARERAWRIGQDKHVTIYRLLSSGTIEEKIYHRQIFKQFLTNKILKDPKQKRFFKNNELHELFAYCEDGNEGTETGAIFAGTGSQIDASPSKNKINKRARSNADIGGNSTSTNTKMAHSNVNEGGSVTGTDDKREKMRLLAKKLSKMIADPKRYKTEKVKKKNRKKRKGQLVEGCVVDNISKQERYKVGQVEDSQQTAKQDDYVLNKLFAKSGVHSALKHDTIMNSSDPDYLLVEGEAERVAKAAVKALKQSRRQCSRPETGIPTWTGQNGSSGSPSKIKAKFGGKKNTKLIGNANGDNKESEPKKTEPAKIEAEADDDKNMFFKMISDKTENQDQSSSSILYKILKRKAASSSEENSDDEDLSCSRSETKPASAKMSLVTAEHDEMLVDIRNYIAFQASIDGQATTQELLIHFKNKLPPKDSALFKSMLNQICTFHRGFSADGIWRLRPDFR